MSSGMRYGRGRMCRFVKITRALLAAAAAAVIMCQGASAKGTDTNYTQVDGNVAKGARDKYTKLRGKGREFEGSYKLGGPVIVPDDGQLSIANMKITGGERVIYTVRLTDIYQAHYWVPVMEA